MKLNANLLCHILGAPLVNAECIRMMHGSIAHQISIAQQQSSICKNVVHFHSSDCYSFEEFHLHIDMKSTAIGQKLLDLKNSNHSRRLFCDWAIENRFHYSIESPRVIRKKTGWVLVTERIPVCSDSWMRLQQQASRRWSLWRISMEINKTFRKYQS